MNKGEGACRGNVIYSSKPDGQGLVKKTFCKTEGCDYAVPLISETPTLGYVGKESQSRLRQDARDNLRGECRRGNRQNGIKISYSR